MEGLLSPPKNLSLDGNIAENWKIFNQKFKLFMEASDLEAKDEKKKTAVFLNLIGDDGLELYNSFTFCEEENKLDDVLAKFEEYCAPKKNIIFERFKFNEITQKNGQLFDSFVSELRRAVKTTEYDKPEEMIRDRIVIGVFDKSNQERLLREPQLTLQKAIDLCRASEISKLQAKILQEEITVNMVKSNKIIHIKNCKFCGNDHNSGQCPAFNKECSKCKKMNHFAKVCRSKQEQQEFKKKIVCKDKKQKKDVHEIKEEDENEREKNEDFYVNQITKYDKEQPKAWIKKIKIGNHEIDVKLDTGAEVSVLPLNTVKRLMTKNKIKQTKVTLVSYGNFKINPVGEIELDCHIQNKNSLIKFMVVKDHQEPLLGLKDCIKLDLIQRVDRVQKKFQTFNDVYEEYSVVFEGLGMFPNQHHITLKDNIVPKIAGIRRVPHVLLDKLKNKLDELEKLGVIRKVNKPTEWLHPLVIVEKRDGDLRLCLDPKVLNDSIKREHYLIPTIDDIVLKLSKKKFFTVLDMKDGYWQVKLDDASADICVFGSPCGRYQFLRLPFGLCSAPEVFQKKNIEIFGDINGVGLYFDDLIITGQTETEHDQNLKLVLERAKKYNLKFNKNKVQFKMNSVKFMGQLFSEKGMVKYVGKFIPNLSQISAPLRELTKVVSLINRFKLIMCALIPTLEVGC